MGAWPFVQPQYVTHVRATVQTRQCMGLCASIVCADTLVDRPSHIVQTHQCIGLCTSAVCAEHCCRGLCPSTVCADTLVHGPLYNHSLCRYTAAWAFVQAQSVQKHRCAGLCTRAVCAETSLHRPLYRGSLCRHTIRQVRPLKKK